MISIMILSIIRLASIHSIGASSVPDPGVANAQTCQRLSCWQSSSWLISMVLTDTWWERWNFGSGTSYLVPILTTKYESGWSNCFAEARSIYTSRWELLCWLFLSRAWLERLSRTKNRADYVICFEKLVSCWHVLSSIHRALHAARARGFDNQARGELIRPSAGIRARWPLEHIRSLPARQIKTILYAWNRR